MHVINTDFAAVLHPHSAYKVPPFFPPFVKRLFFPTAMALAFAWTLHASPDQNGSLKRQTGTAKQACVENLSWQEICMGTIQRNIDSF